MNIGIICEFNPFHAGHKYLIDSVKKSGDNIICCMSSNFVQRGDFAVYDKFTRAKTALQNGADLVIELPTAFSTLSAEGFAQSAVHLLQNLGVTDALAFGAKCDNLEDLRALSKQLQSADTQKEIAEQMKNGVSYPVARRAVVNSPLLDSPNNILATEYLKFTSLPCISVKRIGGGHDSNDTEYSSSAIRANLTGDDVCLMKRCERAVLAKLRCMSADDFEKIADVNEGLQNRIYNAARQATSLEELYNLIKTKRYTMSRIKRIILRAYLGIYGTSYEVPYIRVLGFTQSGKTLLGEIKQKSSLPIVTGINDCPGEHLPFFEEECRYTDLYVLGYPTPKCCGNEQTQKLIVL